MSQAPIMPLATDAYLADTKHLTIEQHGAYLMILMVTWRNNGAPLVDDNVRMARILGITKKNWLKIRSTLVEFFDLSDGFWRQKKLEEMWLAVAKRRETFVQRGRLGGRPKSLKEKETKKATAFQNKNIKVTNLKPITINQKEPPLVVPPIGSNLELSVLFDRTDEGIAVRAWNVLADCCGFSKVQLLTEERRRKLNHRLSSCGGLDGWHSALEKVKNSTFLCGDNERGWLADFDFLLQKKSFTKLMEGAYNNRKKGDRLTGAAAVAAEYARRNAG